MSDSPRVGGSCPSMTLDKGCLAHAVASDDAEPLAGFEVEVQPVEERAAVGQVEPRVFSIR